MRIQHWVFSFIVYDYRSNSSGKSKHTQKQYYADQANLSEWFVENKRMWTEEHQQEFKTLVEFGLLKCLYR